MRITALSGANFMSFRTFEFSVPTNGLHFIGGEVKGQAMSNSNGAGKSSIPEALCFGLYGKTVRNAGKDDIINRDVGKDCVVAVSFENDGHEYTVFRFRGDADNANELRLLKGEQDITSGTMSETQDIIDHILGMNWLVFSNAVIFGENARRFTQAKDSEKKQVFDEIMMFHQYVEAQVRAKDEVKSLKATLQDNESQLDIVLTSIKQYNESLEEEDKRLEEAKQKKKEALTEVVAIEAEINVLRAEIQQGNVKLAELQKDRDSLNEDDTALYQTMTALAGEKSDTLAKYREVESEHNVNLRRLTLKKIELEGIVDGEGLPVGTRCPNCKQPVTDDSIAEMKEHFRVELGEVLKEHSVAEQAFMVAKGSRERIEKDFEARIDDVNNLRQEYNTQLTGLSIKIDDLKNYIFEKGSEIEKKNNQIKMVQGYTDKTIEEIEQRKRQTLEKMEPLQQKLLDLVASVEATKGELEYYEFWVEGFGNKGIKSFLLDEVVPELNRKANYYASMLMDDDIQIEFNTESTLKSGETRDKFNVGITYGGETVAYENCSSGEKGRIDVAILLALQNLIFSRSANNCNLVVFDEVFEHLDITGVERVVNLLREEADDKAILVISHQNELKDYFDNQILVVKDENGSRIEQ